jgi:hypothetical protein
LREGIHPEQFAPEQAHLGKAARLRRLWRSQDTRLRSSGLARARPLLAAPAEALLPSRGLTARELIKHGPRGAGRGQPSYAMTQARSRMPPRNIP